MAATLLIRMLSTCFIAVPLSNPLLEVYQRPHDPSCPWQHNFRRNSEEGRARMLDDLESIHDTLLHAYKAVMLLFRGGLRGFSCRGQTRRADRQFADLSETGNLRDMAP
jgi:hypothetical protein